ncbi:MAG: hypothetical protein ABIN89_25570 [Chitinophagaceae bacterium]
MEKYKCYKLTSMLDLKSYIPHSRFVAEEGLPRINTVRYRFDRLLVECYYPIWFYLKKRPVHPECPAAMLERFNVCDIDGTQSSIFTITSSALLKDLVIISDISS